MSPRIVTLTCPNCGTVVAGNVLERRREQACPGLDCGEVLRFADLPAEDRQHIESNPENYRLE